MKKILKRLFLVFLLVPCLVLFSGCSKDGLSAYEIWKQHNPESMLTEEEWLESLKGDKGDKGDAGEDGNDGLNGDDGKDGEDSISSYKMWEEAFANGDTTLSYVDWVIENFDINFDGEKYVINKNLLSVLEIKTFTTERNLKFNESARNSGSATLYEIDDNGDAYFVTNYHIANNSTNNGVYPYYRLEFYQDSFYYMQGEYVGGSSTYDIAVVKVSAENYLSDRNATPVKIVEEPATAGTPVFAIGNTKGNGINVSVGGVIDIASEDVSITVAGNTCEHRVIRHDAYIINGNSGGGLFDYNGNFVGITNGGDSQDGNIKYAIPADLVQKVADQLIENFKADENSHKLYKIKLGITTNVLATTSWFNPTTELVEVKDIIRITNVASGSPLEQILSEEMGDEDILTGVILNGIEYDITRGYMLDELMIQAKANDTLSLIVTNSETKLQTTLSEITLSSELVFEVR